MTRVDVDLASALGGSAADGAADTVQVIGTAGDDTISAKADGGAAVSCRPSATVRVTTRTPTRTSSRSTATAATTTFGRRGGQRA